MQQWPDVIGEVIHRAATNAGLPALRDGRGACDGDSWVWRWFAIDEPKKAKARAREVVVLVHPETVGKGIAVEVVAVAWLVEQRQIAEKRTYYTRYIALRALNKHKKELESQIKEHLSAAWQGAHDMAKSLSAIEKHRALAAGTRPC